MECLKVETKKQVREFILFPYHLYKHDPLWIPPLKREQKKLFNARQNAVLSHSDYELFLIKNCHSVLGRCAVFIDANFNRHWQERMGFFGSFETVNDQGVADLLLQHCESWLKKRHIHQMRGPISFETQNWGANLDGFDTPARLMSPYNAPYVHDLYQRYGLAKSKDLHIFAAQSRNYPIPVRFLRHQSLLFKKYRLSIRYLNKKDMLRDVRTIVELSNRSLSKNWGYAPIDIKEAEGIARDLESIVWPELIQIIEAAGEPIGFCITLPDIMQLLQGCQGRLFPRAIYRLFFKLRTVRNFRIWALGIVPEFQRKGIDTLLYVHLWQTLKHIDANVEANYILEDNHAMRDAVIKLGMQQIRTVRIYEKEI